MVKDESRIRMAIDERAAGVQIVPAQDVHRKVVANGRARDAVDAGIGRVWVNCADAVTLILPPNDVLVADRGPNAGTWPIMCQPPAGATINGNPGFVVIGDWASQRFFWDGTNFG